MAFEFRRSWAFLGSSAINTATGGAIGAKAADADNLSQVVFIIAMVVFAINAAAAMAGAYFWAKQEGKRPCWNSYTLGAAMTMLTAGAGFTSSKLAYSECGGSFTCLESAIAWGIALGMLTTHAIALLCTSSGRGSYEAIRNP